MLRLAFDFIITWRETRTRPNAYGSIMSLAMPIGLILSGFFADRIGVNHWFLLSGVLIIGIAIACPMITEVRKLDLKQNS